MKLLREILLALLVTFFGTLFVIFTSALVYAIVTSVFADGDAWSILYFAPFAIVSFIPAFLSYKLFRKFRAE